MEKYSVGHKLAAVGFGLIIAIPVTMLSGVVLSDLWNWFAVPPLHVPSLTTWQAIGIMFVVGFFFLGFKRDNYDEDGPFVNMLTMLSTRVVLILLTWGLGAIWHLFI